MFTSTERFAFFEYFRVPYRVAGSTANEALGRGIGRLSGSEVSGSSPALYWCSVATGRHHRSRACRFTLAGSTLACHLTRQPPSALSLGPMAFRWQQTWPIRDTGDHVVAWVWRDHQGNVFLPFDPGEAMSYLWSERYTRLGLKRWTSTIRGTMVTGYYAMRPLLPRRVQIRLRQGYAAHRELPDFPGWPEEHTLHDFYDWLWERVGAVASEPVPYLAPWPHGKEAAFVLTHDVETAAGRDDIETLRGAERELGLRSSWNFVPLRYDVPDDLIHRLQCEGCEIGVHGLRHDGQDLASARKLRRRLPLIREYADRWDAVGFRSPATQRIWKIMATMSFDYDSSYSDTAPYEPQPGGSCTYLPFFNDDLIELPMTLPMDHTLFEILGHTDGSVWQEKADVLRRRGGMILVLVHPDYAKCPGLLTAWRELLERFADDEKVWQALPREVSSWWRSRAASYIERVEGTWQVRGPAANAAIVMFAGTRRAEDAMLGETP